MVMTRGDAERARKQADALRAQPSTPLQMGPQTTQQQLAPAPDPYTGQPVGGQVYDVGQAGITPDERARLSQIKKNFGISDSATAADIESNPNLSQMQRHRILALQTRQEFTDTPVQDRNYTRTEKSPEDEARLAAERAAERERLGAADMTLEQAATDPNLTARERQALVGNLTQESATPVEAEPVLRWQGLDQRPEHTIARAQQIQENLEGKAGYEQDLADAEQVEANKIDLLRDQVASRVREGRPRLGTRLNPEPGEKMGGTIRIGTTRPNFVKDRGPIGPNPFAHFAKEQGFRDFGGTQAQLAQALRGAKVGGSAREGQNDG